MSRLTGPELLANHPKIVYGFFLLHMLVFGSLGVYFAYWTDSVIELYLFQGFAIYGYLIFYRALFGIDVIGWIVVNVALGIWGVFLEIELFLSVFDKQFSDYGFSRHLVPITYYVMYTFLLRQAMLAVLHGYDTRSVNGLYVVVSILCYGALSWLS
ncbi:hypothetical protein [Simiduia aestuariiviva]|uniref:Uncharacterized protein n=1 Tax=Simiduia aestuariiviva TaxID=1510459 RepID=A0A839UHJ5_9GAMM|nr:hypothetical protein [Simiduia aestuariiviva]MBB3166933.1 hypothetical protein [Simiduia aestuariiviva]